MEGIEDLHVFILMYLTMLTSQLHLYLSQSKVSFTTLKSKQSALALQENKIK